MGIRSVYQKPGIVAAVAAVLLGWVLLLPLGTPNPLVRWSYDLLQVILPGHEGTNLVIVHMDEEAMRNYDQKPGQPWSRSIHARLLDRLTRDEPRVVVFDVEMTQPGDPASDDEFARAVGRNRRVVLAGGKAEVKGIPLGYTIVPPLERFETNAAGWGTAKVHRDPDQVARRYMSGDAQETGVAWAAAVVAGGTVTRHSGRRLAEDRWLNYYGSSRPFERHSLTYTDAETQEAGFFRDKAVFIGGQPETLLRGEVADVFGTPFTKWNSRFIPGVEVTAIAYTNLMREDWLRRTGIFTELVLLILTGVIAGLGFHKVCLRTAVWLALGMAVLLVAAGIALVLSSRIWYPWMVVVAAQLPCALMFRLVSERGDIPVALGDAAAGTAGETQESAAVSPEAARDGRPEIADHTMIRCIGEGAYGQVWIARNAVGLYHAVKVLYRSRFGTEAPYERALRGIQKFMPVSRSHEGFVHLLHVGCNNRAGFFFYIMEAGDDVKSGQQIDPGTYAPKTLASELRSRGAIPPRECLAFMLAVTEAVDRLHQHHLIHRDIKPDNLIFVNGRPKLADIDLVTDISGQGEASHIGTEGYMAPEGPGTASADVFSLGRVLYVALTGKPPVRCPELPTHVTSDPECDLFLDLNYIICKACEFDVERRYPSAASMHADLVEVLHRPAT